MDKHLSDSQILEKDSAYRSSPDMVVAAQRSDQKSCQAISSP